MNTKKALCFLLPVLMIVAIKSFGHDSPENVQYYTNAAYLPNENDNMASPACPLVFDIVFFEEGEGRPSDSLGVISPECPLRATIWGSQTVGIPIPMNENNQPIPVWLEIIHPETGQSLLMMISPEGITAIVTIFNNGWGLSDPVCASMLFLTAPTGLSPALNLDFSSYISTGHLIANISAGYVLKVYYCIPRIVSTDGGNAATSSSSTNSLRQLPAHHSTLLTESVLQRADKTINDAMKTVRSETTTNAFNSVINNPVSDVLHLRIHQHDRRHSIEAALWSVQGQPVSGRYIIAPGDTQVDIPTSSLSPGLYVLRLKSGGIAHTHIFVKM